MRLLFQDGPIAGIEIPWFKDVQPGEVMEFSTSTSEPTSKLFYKVTEEFSKGRRILVQAQWQDLQNHAKKITDDLIKQLTKRRRETLRDLIWNYFGFFGCTNGLITSLFAAYNGDCFVWIWQILFALGFIYTAAMINIQTAQRQKLLYCINSTAKIIESKTQSQNQMMKDQALAALEDFENTTFLSAFKKSS